MRKLLAAAAAVLWSLGLGTTLLAAGVLAAAPPAHAAPPVDVVVEDTAGALYRPQLDPALAKISFYEPTRVVVFTRAGDPSDNFNFEVLRFARERHPEWLSPDGQKWADGLYIVAFDTTGRQVGTYFGEDRKVSFDIQGEIQDEMRPLLREAQWTDAAIKGVQAGAERIARPWYRAPVTYWAAGVTGVAAVGGAGGWLLVRAGRRKRFAEALGNGDRAYADVTLHLDETELNASTIPPSSSYGALVLEHWRSFRDQHREATILRERLPGMSPKERSRARNLAEARRYQELAQTLDSLDDAIADANSLLNLDSRWRDAWRRQAGSLETEAGQVEGMLADRDAQGSPETAAALRAGAAQAQERIERLAAGLEDRSVTPDEALDGVKAERESLAALLDRHADAVVEANAKNARERSLMRQKLGSSADGWGGQRRAWGSILDVAYPRLPIVSVVGFSHGVAAGHSAVESARSSSQSTGYGTGGGSFSGSGSSSRF